jgi:maltose alpha-D-glucosyltransferase/alpha-amylase
MHAAATTPTVPGALAPAKRVRRIAPTTDPLWYRQGVFYELHVRAFRDSNGDGIGDFRGLTEKLDYLRDLGVTALWLLPFYPSPLRDDGYDIADYTSIHPAYGTMRDFETFVREGHKRGLRVITELVANHTSDQHPWFQRARLAKPGSAARNFYVWSDTPDRYPDARIIFGDFETSNWSWDPVAGAYYWHRFFSHQPDLNFDNPRVRQALFRVLDFWMDRGVDGLRLDAIPYLYERDGTDCENLPETHAFLRELRHHVDTKYPGRVLLAEANQWPEQSAAYFGNGDECHMAFHFPVMPRMFMAIQMEDRLPIVDIMEQTPAIPASAQWALFLRNHDELTLEMVTDEERDYMYRVYAEDPQARVNLGIRRRLAPLLGNHRRRIELMNGLLFSLPGTPVLYYGDEIGMGDDVHLGDRNGVRTPMQWSADRNAGFSSADRERLYLPVIANPEFHYEAVNVEVQQANPHSLLWWMKRLIALRKRHPAFATGDLRFLDPSNRPILAFLRTTAEETLLVVANLSRFSRPVELDLSEFEGRQPIELFGRIEFPRIGQMPYLLTLGPHEFLWFSLEPVPDAEPASELPVLPASGRQDFVEGGLDARLRPALLDWLVRQPWYQTRERGPRAVEIVDRIPIGQGEDTFLAVLRVSYSRGELETYLIPLSMVWSEGPDDGSGIGSGVAKLRDDARGLTGVLAEATADPRLRAALIETIVRGRRVRGEHGSLMGRLEAAPGEGQTKLELRTRFDPGADPEAEMMRFLASHGAPWTPHLLGELEYQPASGLPGPAALFRELLVHEGDLVGMTRDSLRAFIENAATRPKPATAASVTAASLYRESLADQPSLAYEMAGSYLELARSTGNRVAELHTILAGDHHDPAFAPERLTRHHQAALYQDVDSLAVRITRRLRGLRPAEPSFREDLDAVAGFRADVKPGLGQLLVRGFGGSRIRVHGHLDLNDLMRSDRGLVMVDFKGDTSRPASERRRKRLAFADVASMIEAFHDVSLGRMRREDLGGSLRPEDREVAEAWARQWYQWVAAAFLRGYRESTAQAGAAFLPEAQEDWIILLDAWLMRSLLTGLDRDLESRPERVAASIRGLRELLGR